MALIHEKVTKVMAELGAIGKDRENTHFNYNFRGIDDVYNACHAVLVKHGVFTIPWVCSHKVDDYVDQKGKRTVHVVAEIEYQFYAAEDGSMLRSKVLGEGADSGDKACNKAMAAAHKYALIQSLCIPTEEKKDSEYDDPSLDGEKRSAEPPARHPTVEAAEKTFGVEAKINDEQYVAITGHFERLKWPRPHATNWLRKHHGVPGPSNLTAKGAAECLAELETLQPETKAAAK